MQAPGHVPGAFYFRPSVALDYWFSGWNLVTNWLQWLHDFGEVGRSEVERESGKRQNLDDADHIGKIRLK